MNRKIKEFVEAVKAEMGDNFVGVIDKIAECGQLAIATNEPDCGTDGVAKYCDTIDKIMMNHGLLVPFMPFPVKGKICYCFAGLNEPHLRRAPLVRVREVA